MGLDAHVRCACIKQGRALPHPFPERLFLDETAEPLLKGDPSDAEWDAHDQWFEKSCEHSGYLVAVRLGNINLIARLREFLKHLQGNPGPKFPILLNKVVYDGTHSGDWIAGDQAPTLLAEVDTVLHSRDILDELENEFFSNMRSLCLASIETGNPIVF